MAQLDKRGWKDCQAVIDDPTSSDAEKQSARERQAAIKAWKDSLNTTDSKATKPDGASVKQSQSITCNWPAITPDIAPIGEQLIGGLNVITAIAVRAVESEHPGIDTNSNLFGQMVSATKGHLITLQQIEATQKQTKALIEVLENLPVKKTK